MIEKNEIRLVTIDYKIKMKEKTWEYLVDRYNNKLEKHNETSL